MRHPLDLTNIEGWETSSLMEAGLKHGPLWLGENYPWQVDYLETMAIDTLPTSFPRFNSPAGVALVVALINFDRESELDLAETKIDTLFTDIRIAQKEIEIHKQRSAQLRAHGFGQVLAKDTRETDQ